MSCPSDDVNKMRSPFSPFGYGLIIKKLSVGASEHCRDIERKISIPEPLPYTTTHNMPRNSETRQHFVER